MNLTTAKQRNPDPSHDIWRQTYDPLGSLFSPASIAIIGATETPNSVGCALAKNMIGVFRGPVYPVHPRRSHVFDAPAFRSVLEVPGEVDLAVIATPADTVPDAIAQCVEKGVRAAIVISAGFKELGKPGEELERRVAAAAAGRLRIIGPNCLGVMNPYARMNATFADRMARPGNVAFLSQSGALCTSILDWSFKAHVGFSAFVSLGSMLDLGWGDLIDHLGDDPKTKAILIYMETIGDARAFLSAAREVSLAKPIIVLKAGRTQEAAKAAASHTGSMAGSDAALDAAFARAGVIRVDAIGELFHLAEILAKQPRPAGPRLSILTNAGGPGVLATDALVSGGGKLADLSASTLSELNACMPAHWSHGNPVDILGDAGPDRYAKAFDIVARDENTDAILVVLTPQSMTEPEMTARTLVERLAASKKPVLASWMGGVEVERGATVLNQFNVPNSHYPDEAARMFNFMWRYQYNLEQLYQTPGLPRGDERRAGRDDARRLVDAALKEGRTVLTEEESKRVLSCYGIPTIETYVAGTADEAVQAARRSGYPAVVKLHSRTITHKTDVGGVKLGLKNEDEVRAAYESIRESVTRLKGVEHFQGVTVQRMADRSGQEILLGSFVDAQFGPVIAFGWGGQLVEVVKDFALALPPLNATLARRLVERTKVYHALQGVRGAAPVDMDRLFEIMVRFGELVLEQPRIREIDINPIMASGSGIVALDARVILHPKDVADSALPRPVIRPYPSQYVSGWTDAHGEEYVIRPIRPEDEPAMAEFHRTLSEKTVYRRYLKKLGLSERIAHDRLARVCFNDYDREIALVVESKAGAGILAVGRLSRFSQGGAELAVLVGDSRQGRGIGRELFRLLIDVARKEGLKTIVAHMLPENAPIRALCTRFGFRFREDGERLTAALAL